MRYYKFEEIENKHGQYIAYISNQSGNTELEKFQNLHKSVNLKFTKYDFNAKLTKFSCLVYFNSESFRMEIFNHLEELVEIYEDLQEDNINEITQSLKELGYL